MNLMDRVLIWCSSFFLAFLPLLESTQPPGSSWSLQHWLLTGPCESRGLLTGFPFWCSQGTSRTILKIHKKKWFKVNKGSSRTRRVKPDVWHRCWIVHNCTSIRPFCRLLPVNTESEVLMWFLLISLRCSQLSAYQWAYWLALKSYHLSYIHPGNNSCVHVNFSQMPAQFSAAFMSLCVHSRFVRLSFEAQRNTFLSSMCPRVCSLTGTKQPVQIWAFY